MGRIVVVVLALAVLGTIAYKVMYGSAPPIVAPKDEPQVPTQQLENFRGAAKRIEADQQQHVDDVEKKAFGNE